MYALTVGDFVNETARGAPRVVGFDVSGGRGSAKVVQEFQPGGDCMRVRGWRCLCRWEWGERGWGMWERMLMS